MYHRSINESIVTVMLSWQVDRYENCRSNGHQPKISVLASGVLKPFQSGFQNEYVKVKKQIGSGYILVSGLLMLYLVHRLFNRK